MLLIRNLLNALFVLSFVACSANEQQKRNINKTNPVEVISIGDADGDWAAFAIVFSDSNALERALQKNQIDDFRGFVEMNIDSKNFISRSALMYLKEYIEKHCKDYLSIDTNKIIYGSYEIKLISDGSIQNCRLYKVDLDFNRNYFKGMQSWVEKSPYKNELKDLIRYLDWRIKSIEKQINKIGR